MMTQSDLDADWLYAQAKDDHDQLHDSANLAEGCEWCDAWKAEESE